MAINNIHLLEQLLNESNDAFQVSDEHGKFIYVNQKACEHIGISKEEFLRIRVQDIEKIFQAPGTWEAHIEDLQKQGKLFIEGRHIRKDGSSFPVEASVKLISVEKKKYVVAIIRDISERKKQQKMLDDILNALPVSIFLKDQEGKYLFINQGAAELLSISPQEAIGKAEHDFLPPDFASESARLDQIVLRSPEKPLFFQRDIKINGKTRHMFAGKRVVNSYKDQKSALILCFSFDNTEAVQAQHALEAQKRFVQQVIDSDPNLIFIKDWEGKFKLINQAMADLFGISKEALIERNNAEVHKNLQETSEYQKIDRQVISSGQEIILEEPFTQPEGEVMWFQTTKKPFYFENNETCVLAVSVDITQRKKDAEELLRAKKTKEQFLANMSHEIRTPVNGISGMLNLLGDTVTTAEQRKYIDSIKEATNNLRVIINDILDISAIESGKLRFEKIGFKPNHQLSAVINSFKLQAQEKGVRLLEEARQDACVVLLGDPVRLNQILMNLVSNALKFTYSGQITVSTRLLKSQDDLLHVEFAVEDTGIGIPQEKFEEIFESFRQADTSVTRRFGGTGLGLTICKQLTEMQGGSITVESEVGKGSVFRFVIPYEKGTNADLVSKHTNVNDQASKGKMTFEGVRVLLVEDNDINRIYARNIISKKGCEVDIAENGLIALEKIRKNEYDAVLMDIQMPVMDGLEACKSIRTQFSPPKSRIPIIALTANAIKGDAEKCLQAGMNDYISKPFEPEDLYSTLSKVLKATNMLKKITNHQQEEMSESTHNNTEVSEKADLSYMHSICDGDLAFMSEMVSTFIRDTPLMLEELKVCVENSNWELAGRMAHKIKPSMQFIGMNRTYEILKTIELESKTEKASLVLPSLLKQIINNIQQNIPELQAHLDQNFSQFS